MLRRSGIRSNHVNLLAEETACSLYIRAKQTLTPLVCWTKTFLVDNLKLHTLGDGSSLVHHIDLPDAFSCCLLLFFPHGSPVAGKLLVSENRTSGCVIAHYLRLGDRSSSISAKICRVSILPADVTSAISYMNSLQVPRVPVKVKFGHLAKNEWVVSFRNQRAVEFSGLLKLRFRLSLQLLLVEYGHLIIIIV